jgi:hypothetical protein
MITANFAGRSSWSKIIRKFSITDILPSPTIDGFAVGASRISRRCSSGVYPVIEITMSNGLRWIFDLLVTLAGLVLSPWRYAALT